MTGPAWRVFLRWARPYRRHLAAGLLLSLLSAAAGLSLPLVAQALIGRVAGGQPVGTPVALIASLVIGGSVLSGFGWYLFHRTAITLVRDARAALVSHLLRLTLPTLDRTQPGDLLARVTWDTTAFRALTGETLVGLGVNVPIILTAIGIMAYLDLPMLLILLVVAGAAAVVFRVLVPRIQGSSTAAHEAVGVVSAGAERALGAIRTIRAAGAERDQEAILHAAADRARDVSVRAQLWSLLATNVTGVTYQLSFVVVLAVGGARVATSDLAVGTLVAFLLYVFYLIGPMQSVVAALAAYQIGTAGLRRVTQVLAYPAEDDHPPAAVVTDRAPLSLEFRSVHFRYEAAAPVLRGLSFTAPAGAVTALVGLSGSGKSTVFGLIERFYHHTAGTIAVGGVDLRDWHLPDLRHAIGYVEQDAPVLAGTLRDNLLLGAAEATEGELREVLDRASLGAFVTGLPDGLDTVVGSRGVTLSGGERQRVAIARALLRRPRLLLLDEATSQLDAVNEAALRDTVQDLAGATTVIVVAHRLSTVVRADQIVVLDSGVARATGRHQDLAGSDPLYAELLATQLVPDLPADHAGNR